MLTQELAQFLYEFQYDDIPREAASRAKMHIFDTIGVMLAGSCQPVGGKIKAYVRALGGRPVSTVFGAGFKTSQPLAALANGTMAHALDFDDDSDTIFSHPSCTLVPPILALGEPEASGKDILTAFILGHEFSARLANAPGLLPKHYEQGWHPTSTLGIMGATASAAKLLKLNIKQIRHAIGIAASEASGIQANFGFMAKPFHAGSAASKAVVAAMLAKSGFKSNPEILESESGFLDIFGADLTGDMSRITSGLGKNWDLLWPGINIKRYPCCAYTHAAIDMLLEIMEAKDIHSKNIKSIHCTISPRAGRVLSNEMPEQGLGAKFYLPYCLAVASMHGEVSIQHFETLDYENPEIERLLACIQINKDPELNSDGLGLGACLSISTFDNKTFSKERVKPVGSGKNPLDWEQLRFKFRSCINGIINEKQVFAIASAVNLMEHLNSIDELLDLISS
ncbi:MAG: MmgE/PrpD family protein [Desulfobacterales bacterium]|nr:MmgE/PrpD family protein [Desulfobacterales bacterium]